MISRLPKSKLLLIWMVLALAVGAFATPPPVQSNPADSSSDTLSVYQRRIDMTIDGLSHAVDLWHDANLLENPDLIARYNVLIENILHADLRATEMVLKTLEADCKADGSSSDPKVKAELEDSYRILFEKEKLANLVHESATFTEKYRYLGGYINALRKELGMPRLRLADDKEFPGEGSDK